MFQNPLTNKKYQLSKMPVDINFGTRAFKITPGHDFNDFKIGKNII